MSESLEESAAAYTKATAKKCILEKVNVKTGEESESNVLQVDDTLSVSVTHTRTHARTVEERRCCRKRKAL